MNTIHIRKFGLAVGLTWALLYLGRAVVMTTVGREGTESFFLGWLVGACIAGVYNFRLVKK